MKLTLAALLLSVFLLECSSAQKDCQTTYKESLAKHDKFNIPSRFLELSMEGESYSFDTYKSVCKNLTRDVYTVMNTVSKELTACPENQKQLDITKFDTDFFCSFDFDFKNDFFKNRDAFTNSECMDKIYEECSQENLDYCDSKTISELTSCASKSDSEACRGSVEYFTRYLQFGLKSAMCNKSYIFDRFLKSFSAY